MLLGDLIARFDDEAVAEEAVLAIGDLAMLATLREQAAATGLGVGACMATAARRYAAEASDEEWITLLGVMGKAEDPGAAYLKRALAYGVRAPHERTCGHGGHA
jgi:hypothetical protein